MALLLTLVEFARLPVAYLGSAMGPAVGAVCMGLSLLFFTPLTATMLGANWLRPHRPRSAALVEGIGVGALAHFTLLPEMKFATYPPLLGLTLLLSGFVALASAQLAEQSRDDAAARRGLAVRALAALGVIAFQIGNSKLQRGLSPAFHLYLHLGSFALGSVALRGLWTTRRRSGPLTTGAVAVLAFTGWGLVSLSSEAGRQPRSVVAAHTTLGRALASLRTSVDSKAPDSPASPELASAEAWAIFDEHSGLPPLPEDWAFAEYNLLLITIEALRQDQTSLGDGQLDTTPQLAALAHRPGSHWFTSAHAPASVTFQSSSALLAMRYASSLPMTLGRKDWLGTLHETELVPSVLRSAGYLSFWVGHDHKTVFTKLMLGFRQHFDSAELFTFGDKMINGDRKIADAARRRLTRVAGAKRPFFGWVFFASPHERYRPHYPDMPGDTPLELYRQELRFADEQLGRVLARLRELGLSENTIVIVTGDHGEEFGEHGGTGHARGVHREIRHIPLVVHIPGTEGGRFDAPTSSIYVFPWLLSRAKAAPRSFADACVRDILAPFMKATRGAVITELLGRRTMKTALTTGQHSLIHDFIADSTQIYDLEADPTEQADLAPTPAPAFDDLIEGFDAYRAERAAKRRFELPPH
jgi:arylsulfatase A-like enzyme